MRTVGTAAVLLGYGVFAADDWVKGKDEQGRAVQKMEIKAPAMTEEDQYGYQMPERYRCNSCKAVIFHLNEALQKRQPKSRRLQSWEYTEIFDETCSSGFKGYGVSWVNEENTLSGPGLRMESNSMEPGMGAIQMGGDSWDKRLSEFCRKLVYDKVGEEEVYEHFRASGNQLTHELCFEESRDCQTGPQALPKPEAARKTKKEKKEKKENKEKKEKKAKVVWGGATTATVDSKGDVAAVDVDTFLAGLAKEHGKAPEEYTRKRSQKDWEQLFVAAAGRIFSAEAGKDVLTV